MYEYYLLFLIALVACMAFFSRTSARVKTTFRAYQDIASKSHMTGYDTATRLLRRNGVTDVSVQKVKGSLTDHFHPTQKAVNLSQATYGSDSVAAIAVAAHEVGHVMQKKEGYLPYKLRQVLVPITNMGSRLAIPLVFIGFLLDFSLMQSGGSQLGYTLAMIGVVGYGLSTVFALVTLPVEFDASRRAKQMLLEEGIVTQSELPYVEEMLGAAARTYVASLLVSTVLFLRFLMWVMMLFGGRRRRR